MRKRFAGAALVVIGLGMAASLAWRWRQARVQRESATVVESVRRVMKLATVEMTISDWRLRRDSKNLFGFLPIPCEKTRAVFFRGKVSAGFDLQTDATALQVTTDNASRRVSVHLPPPRLLYTDVPAPDLLVTDGSLCNPVDAQDYASMHAEARKAVEGEALARGILAQATTQLRTILVEVLRPLGYEVVVEVAAPPLLGPQAAD